MGWVVSWGIEFKGASEQPQGVCGKKVGDMTWGGRGGQPSP